MDLPMIAFTLEGENGSISLEIDEVFGFPEETAYGGGFGACGAMHIQAEGLTGTWSVDVKHYFNTGELNRFEKELARCYENLGLSGTATLENAECELELALSFGKTGHVAITGKFEEHSHLNNMLHFEIGSDQTYIPKMLSQLRCVREVFGDHSARITPASIPVKKAFGWPRICPKR